MTGSYDNIYAPNVPPDTFQFSSFSCPPELQIVGNGGSEGHSNVCVGNQVDRSSLCEEEQERQEAIIENNIASSILSTAPPESINFPASIAKALQKHTGELCDPTTEALRRSQLLPYHLSPPANLFLSPSIPLLTWHGPTGPIGKHPREEPTVSHSSRIDEEKSSQFDRKNSLKFPSEYAYSNPAAGILPWESEAAWNSSATNDAALKRFRRETVSVKGAVEKRKRCRSNPLVEFVSLGRRIEF